MQLGTRQEAILGAVVEQYIRTGQPVGSKTLSQILPFTVSSATIRNEMSDLSVRGFLEQRHTSGGRIPSGAAYRYYIDHLMEPKSLSSWERDRIQSALAMNAGDPERLLADGIRLLADMTGCASFYTKLADDKDVIAGLELIPAGGRKAMIVMLTSGGIVKSSVCRIDGDMDDRFRDVFYSEVRQRLIGTPLPEVNTAMLQSVAVSLGDMLFPMVSVLTSLTGLCEEACRSEIVLDGETNLVSHEDLVDEVNQLLAFLSGKEKLKEFLNSRLQTGEDFEILIGRESQMYELVRCSVLLSKYSYGSCRDGTIGIIGSTRLDYPALVPKFGYLTGLVGKLLAERGSVYEQ